MPRDDVCQVENRCYGHLCLLERCSARQLAVRKSITHIHVRAINMRASRGILSVGSLQFPCMIGRSGRSYRKKEGDGTTPVGCWQLVALGYRADRDLPPRSCLPARPIGISAGWCDAVGDRNYNRPVKLPYTASHEKLRRNDGLYDVIVILSHNQRPRIQDRGSAVFLHLADPKEAPTAGCIALSRRHMALVLAQCGRRTRLVIWSSSGCPNHGSQKLPSQHGHESHHI